MSYYYDDDDDLVSVEANLNADQVTEAILSYLHARKGRVRFRVEEVDEYNVTPRVTAMVEYKIEPNRCPRDDDDE